MKPTRRQLAAAALAAIPLTAQQPASAPEDLDAGAKARVKASAAALSPVPLPMSTEPAFQFKAL